ncbi:uncharacterized protein THITE_2119361 [Thermothielavioides terrestris NRRL 8126]|uniref:Uncharacterized protein n=2 Tax=Thermothielavioides terrestris TaxID=2587410 RepID=G2RBP5_THETT|nr:uncharacterized protein THITE_2119361 [Thermothielavioides terrestris NRRL 8126]AEO69216.1 hypothetical protein THITE_2119361 [Thermothielavioides terrestris NRRL 8126]
MMGVSGIPGSPTTEKLRRDGFSLSPLMGTSRLDHWERDHSKSGHQKYQPFKSAKGSGVHWSTPERKWEKMSSAKGKNGSAPGSNNNNNNNNNGTGSNTGGQKQDNTNNNQDNSNDNSNWGAQDGNNNDNNNNWQGGDTAEPQPSSPNIHPTSTVSMPGSWKNSPPHQSSDWRDFTAAQGTQNW